MKKTSMQKAILFIVAGIVLITIFHSCASNEKIRYYSQRDNYVCVTGTVSHIKLNEESDSLYLGFSETSPILDDNTFKIVGRNLEIVRNRGIEEKITIGSQVEFITAPKYYGDGYVMPIVAIFVEGEMLLDFENGYDNWLSWINAGK